MQPLVSVIVPTYNRLQYLPAAIDSVLAQTFQDWELIIADDGSDAPTLEYLDTLAQLSRVEVIRLAHSGNPGVARNAALRIASGEYVAFLDSDDSWMPTKLDVQTRALRASVECRWSYTDHVRIDAAGTSINSQRNPHRTLPQGQIVEQLLRLEAGTPTPTVMAERALIEEAGAFDEQQGLHEDYDLWLRMALRSKVLVLAQPLSCVRRHDDHFSSGGVRNFEARLRVFEKIQDRVTGLRPRAVLRSERARQAGGLAAAYATAQDSAGVWRTIAASWRYSWRSGRWYVACARAAIRVLMPQWLLMFVRQARQSAARQ
jgi:glycosyltransferase involved in cell wall biosynthesis